MNTERINPEPLNAQPTLPLLAAEVADATTVDAVASPDTAASTGPAASPALTPRTRWAAIVWGVFFAALAWTGIWILSSSARRDDLTDWFAGLTPGTIAAVSLLSLGVLVLIAGLVGLIRRAQRAARPSQP
ncbi:hypothetical protein [Microbacterium sp. H1-D42]|uniref:hypothetical protein n=1 Tax=Microbacterium sp. H1-D42 TaxID=2925844 RepID=UPI001F52B7C7|nr:hypothetical protein [Microbacterium sp. H1-D42]UNK71556.1 hypothetical protein MNR00_03610 [Microbacterium sp. H1-D42]